MPSIPPAELEKRLGTIQGSLPQRGRANSLSVAMIVKNEEQNIEAAIRSFMPFADEIVVNDTGSTDRTLEILSRLPVKVIQNPWEGDFSKARNQSLAACSCAWILWMDADDRVPESSVEDLKRLKTAPLDRSFGFQVINTQSGLPLGARFFQTRMFPNHPKIRFERKVHEQIIYAIAGLGLHAMFIETEIWHTGYEVEAVKKQKSLRNLDLLLGDPDYLVDPILPMQVGDAYSILEDWPRAIEAYQTAYNIPNCKQIQGDAWAEIPNSLGRAYQSLGDYSSAEKWFKTGLDAQSSKVEPVFFLGELYQKMGRDAEAVELFERALEMPRSHSSVANQYDILKIHAFHNVCKHRSSLGLYAQCLELAEEFYRQYPQVLDAALHRARSLLSLKRPADAEQVLRDLLGQSPQTKEAWDLLWFALDQRKSDEEIKALRRQAAEYFPEYLSEEQGSKRLSVAMIVKNEAENLPACLQSIQGLWDELVIVDTGSSDRTVEIARSFGARVLAFDWVNDFSAARNVSLEACTGAWILWLDADDRIAEEEIPRLRKLCEAPADRAYGLLVHNTTDLGVTGECFSQIRLFPKHPKIRFEGKVHEQVLASIQNAGFGVEFKTVKILHTGYVDQQVVAEKQKRNLEILLSEAGSRPDLLNAVKQYSVAGAYQDLGDFEKAIAWYHKSEARARKVGEDPHVKEYAPVKVVQCLAQLGQKKEARAALDLVLALSPLNPEARLLDAQLKEGDELVHEAFSAYLRLLVYQEQATLMPVDFNGLKFKAIRYLAEVLHRSGFAEQAVRLLKMGKSLQSGETLSSDEVLSLLLDVELFENALEMLEFEHELCHSAENLLQRVRVLVLLNRIEESLVLLEQGLRAYPMQKGLLDFRDLLVQDLGVK